MEEINNCQKKKSINSSIKEKNYAITQHKWIFYLIFIKVCTNENECSTKFKFDKLFKTLTSLRKCYLKTSHDNASLLKYLHTSTFMNSRKRLTRRSNSHIFRICIVYGSCWYMVRGFHQFIHQHCFGTIFCRNLKQKMMLELRIELFLRQLSNNDPYESQ